MTANVEGQYKDSLKLQTNSLVRVEGGTNGDIEYRKPYYNDTLSDRRGGKGTVLNALENR